MAFLHGGYSDVPVALALFAQRLVGHAVGGCPVEDAVIFKSQYRLYAVDSGLVPRTLDEPCRRGLVHHTLGG